MTLEMHFRSQNAWLVLSKESRGGACSRSSRCSLRQESRLSRLKSASKSKLNSKSKVIQGKLVNFELYFWLQFPFYL